MINDGISRATITPVLPDPLKGVGSILLAALMDLFKTSPKTLLCLIVSAYGTIGEICQILN